MNFLKLLFVLPCFLTIYNREPCCKIEVPNYVSANRDGIHVFAIMTACKYSYCEMKLYDRWGNRLFDEKLAGEKSLDSLNKKLDKLFFSKKLKDGVYFYVLKFAEEKDTCSQKGNISIFN